MTILESGGSNADKAIVNKRGHLAVSAVGIPEGTYVSLVDNLGFGLDTGILTIPASFDGPVLMLQNDDNERDLIVNNVSVIIDAASTGATASAFRNPTVTTLGANTPKVSLNNNFETNVPPDATAEIWDNATGTAGITGITAIADGTIGPFPIPAAGVITGSQIAILGQTNRLTINVASGAAGFECTVSIAYYYDTTGVK